MLAGSRPLRAGFPPKSPAVAGSGGDRHAGTRKAGAFRGVRSPHSVTSSDDRRAILARRRRFVLAALAGAGLRAPSVLAQTDATEQPQSEGEAEPEPDAPAPQICLSDMDLEGELERPPEKPNEVTLSGPLSGEPQVCLSIIPETSNSRLRHDGFYLRLAAGPSYAWTALDADSGERTLSGFALALALDFGITIVRGLVVGAGVSLLHQPDDAERNATFVSVGPLVDYFPDPYAGLHFGARLAPAIVFLSGAEGRARAIGAGAAAFVGYDAFVLDDWSLGAALEAGATLAGGRTDTDESFTARGLHAGVRLGLLWH